MLEIPYPDVEKRNVRGNMSSCIPAAVIPCARRGTRILVKASSLSVGIDEVEPFFCSMAMYDLKPGGGGKISEVGGNPLLFQQH